MRALSLFISAVLTLQPMLLPQAGGADTDAGFDASVVAQAHAIAAQLVEQVAPGTSIAAVELVPGPDETCYALVIVDGGARRLELGFLGPFAQGRDAFLPLSFMSARGIGSGAVPGTDIRATGIDDEANLEPAPGNGSYGGPTDFVPPVITVPPTTCTPTMSTSCNTGPDKFTLDSIQCICVPPHVGHTGEGWVLHLNEILAAATSGQSPPDANGIIWFTKFKTEVDHIDVYVTDWFNKLFGPLVPMTVCVDGNVKVSGKLVHYSKPVLDCQAKTVSVGIDYDCLLAALQTYANNGTPLPSDEWIVHIGFTLCDPCECDRIIIIKD
jgi:hypothetical protein